MSIFFDDSPHDKQWSNNSCGNPDGEGNFWIVANPTPDTNAYREIIAGSILCDKVNPALGVTSYISDAGNNVQYEVAIDLNNSAFAPASGDTAGLFMKVNKPNTNGRWPLNGSRYVPFTYGDLILAQCGDSGKPCVDINLNQKVYYTGDTLKVFANITNDETPDKVEIKVWTDFPGDGAKVFFRHNSYFVEANADYTITIPSFHTFYGEAPAGDYTANARFLNPITGETICLDSKPFRYER